MSKVATGRVFAAGTLLALVISVPMIAVILIMHYIIQTNVMITGVAGVITLFAAMGFGFKLSKKLAVRPANDPGSGNDLEKK